MTDSTLPPSRYWTPDELQALISAMENGDTRTVPRDILAVFLIPTEDTTVHWLLCLPDVPTKLDPLYSRDALLACASHEVWQQLADMLGTRQQNVMELPSAFIDMDSDEPIQLFPPEVR